MKLIDGIWTEVPGYTYHLGTFCGARWWKLHDWRMYGAGIQWNIRMIWIGPILFYREKK